MIRADEMPYRVGMPYRDGEPIVYDSGDYPGALAEGARRRSAGSRRSARARREARRDGRYLGLGIGCYIEGTGVGPFESAIVRIDPAGKIYVASGACPQGQGMETIFAQVVADLWKVAPDDVVVALADTAAIAIGFGTMASRSTVTVSAAMHHASEQAARQGVRDRRATCSNARRPISNCATGGVGVVGVPGTTVSLARVAQAARPGLGPRPPARGRCRARGDLLLGAADRHLELCGACGDRRGRPRDRPG